MMIFIASCAKDELEAPGEEVRALDNNSDGESFENSSTYRQEHVNRGSNNGSSVEINDDDDEEDEDRNPQK